MSIASVITEGFGSGASIPYVVLQGFSSGAAAAAATIPTNEYSLNAVYIKRGKQVLLFNSADEAYAYAIAEQKEIDAKAKAQKKAKQPKKPKEIIYPPLDS